MLMSHHPDVSDEPSDLGYNLFHTISFLLYIAFQSDEPAELLLLHHLNSIQRAIDCNSEISFLIPQRKHIL